MRAARYGDFGFFSVTLNNQSHSCFVFSDCFTDNVP